MARMKNVDGVNIPLTAEEETARDAEEAAWVSEAPSRNAQAEINRLEGTVTPRRIREMTTDAGKDWVDAVEAAIAVERAKL